MRQQTVWTDGNLDAAVLPVGQSIGLIHDVVSCKELVERMVKQEGALLKDSNKRLGL
jgi:nitronate monooxygenase